MIILRRYFNITHIKQLSTTKDLESGGPPFRFRHKENSVDRKSIRRNVRKPGEVRFILSVLFTGLFSLCAGHALLQSGWNPENAVWWLLSGALTFAVVVWRISIALIRETQSLPHSFFPGLANRITIFRGLVICGLAGFLFSKWPEGIAVWVPGTLFGTSLLLDCLDGYVARLRNETSAFGEFLDRDFDALGTLIAVLLIIRYQRLPYWYVTIGATYYVFILAQWWRQKRGQPIYPLPPSKFRRYASALQSLFITAVLLPLPLIPEPSFIAVIFAIPVLAGFLRDWRFVAGYGRE